MRRQGGREEGIERRSRNGKINKEGRMLVEGIREKGWFILNGETEGDEEENWTYTGGRGESVIDYVLVEEEEREEIERLEVGDKVDSDHHPVVVWMKRREDNKRVRGGRGRVCRGLWDEEGREKFKDNLGRIEQGERSVQCVVGDMTRRIREALKKTEREGEERRRRGRGWWDEECREKKRGVRRALRKWRKGDEQGTRYRKERKEYRELCERKRKEENKRWEREIQEIRSEEMVWKVVRQRKEKTEKDK